MSQTRGYGAPEPPPGAPGYAPGTAGGVPPAEQKAATSSLGDLVGDVAADLSTLMRQELELAKAELRESATRAGKGAGMYGGAGVAGHFVLLFLSLALWWALGNYVVGLGWSAVIVAVLWGIVAAVLAARAKKEMQAVKGLPRTAETVKRIPESLKPSEEPR
ncbi:phage holin family protein [Sinomonas halotolerans]|uniref:Phage holin family protein n=1 Tax=Sinomonas halotolerans TaxID=1644133 RepID=A0ABU9WXI0_9MICC